MPSSKNRNTRKQRNRRKNARKARPAAPPPKKDTKTETAPAGAEGTAAPLPPPEISPEEAPEYKFIPEKPSNPRDYSTKDIKRVLKFPPSGTPPAELKALKRELKRRKAAARKAAEEPAAAAASPLDMSGPLDYDPALYDVFHRMAVEWPILSIDIIADQGGAARTEPPFSLFLAGGTQSTSARNNSVQLFHVSRLAGTRDETGLEPSIASRRLHHHGAVNRVRAMPQAPWVLASWSELGAVNLLDASDGLRELGNLIVDAPIVSAPSEAFRPGGVRTRRARHAQHLIRSHNCFREEGYALAWSPVDLGLLAAGDCESNIRLFRMRPDGTPDPEPELISAHTQSVEDIAFAPAAQVSASVFASCSVDRSVLVWDARDPVRPAQQVPGAHDADVNVVDWSPNAPALVSGGDDGIIKVWDLRSLAAPQHAFTLHRGPITSVQWSPIEPDVFAALSEDGSLSIWDLDVENLKREDERTSKDVPPQLMFLHMDMEEPKELRWHPQVPGMIVTAAANGLNFFKPLNIGVDHTSLLDDDDE